MGGEFDMVLADGTRVWLNSATKLRYPTRFTGKNREVYVEGEAFFSVCKDSAHPFSSCRGGLCAGFGYGV